MKCKECVLFVLLLFVFCIPQTYGQEEVSSHQNKVRDSTEVLRQIMAIPESAIPPNLLTDAHAVVVIPEMIKAGFAEVYKGAMPVGFDIEPYRKEEAAAKKKEKGMWTLGFVYMSPMEWRKANQKSP